MSFCSGEHIKLRVLYVLNGNKIGVYLPVCSLMQTSRYVQLCVAQTYDLMKRVSSVYSGPSLCSLYLLFWHNSAAISEKNWNQATKTEMKLNVHEWLWHLGSLARAHVHSSAYDSPNRERHSSKFSEHFDHLINRIDWMRRVCSMLGLWAAVNCE